MRSFEKADYKVKLSEVIGRLREICSVPAGPALSLWCGSSKLGDKWCVRNHKNSAKDINFEIHLCHNASQYRKLFVGCTKCRGFGILPQRYGEVFLAVTL